MDGIVKNIEETMSFAAISVQILQAGMDYIVVLQGGDRPHIGCSVLSIPRRSLTGDGSWSVTSSVQNLTGHKDEYICRYLAEAVAKKKKATVVCTGGFHLDDITQEQIEEVIETVKKIAGKI